MIFLQAASIGLHQPAESIALLVAFLKTSMPKKSIMKWLMLLSAIGEDKKFLEHQTCQDSRFLKWNFIRLLRALVSYEFIFIPVI